MPPITPDLDDWFGPKEQLELPTPRQTAFPHVKPGVREYLDDMLEGVRELYADPNWFPDKLMVKRWRAQAAEIFNAKGYVQGFLSWAVVYGNMEFRQKGQNMYWTGPMSFVYLFDRFEKGEVGGVEAWRRDYEEGEL